MDNFSKKLHNLIPGGCHTYSRGDDQFPSNTPPLFVRGHKSYLYDYQNNKFLDYGMGLRSVNIGYGNKKIAKAAYKEIIKGNNLSRASYTELKAAELMTNIIDSAEMVKFAKHGSTVTTAAIKLARAYTGKKYILVPKEHPFFSFDDWFIGSTQVKKGVLEETSNFTLQFSYGDINSLNELINNYNNQIAAIIMEPATGITPCPDQRKLDCCRGKNCYNFLHEVRSISRAKNILLILDEMITGFRWHISGAQKYYNVDPDLSTFGKCMANGFSIAALCGKKEIMKLGSINQQNKERVFLTSTTHGAEMVSLGAFIKTVEILKNKDVINKNFQKGQYLITESNKISKSLGLLDYFYFYGTGFSPYFKTKDLNKKDSLEFRTLFLQEMMNHNIIIPYVSISYSHELGDINYTLECINDSLKIYKKALDEGIDKYLKSSIIKPVFRKYN